MSGSVIHSQSAAMVPAVYSAGQPASLPVAIDYPAALALPDVDGSRIGN
ncbi:hypothetical protein EC07E033_47000 [Escherichia coli]|nr:resolvase ResA [Escherichia coli O145:H34]GIP93826.1 hypothetical protein EC07E033_47000 [Escherichia coli]